LLIPVLRVERAFLARSTLHRCDHSCGDRFL